MLWLQGIFIPWNVYIQTKKVDTVNVSLISTLRFVGSTWNLLIVVVVQFFSHVWFFVTPWTMPGFPGLHSFLEFAQTHVHWVDNAIQPSYPLSSSPFSCPQCFPASAVFQWVSFSHQIAEALEFQLQHQSFPWIFRVDFLAVQGTLKSFLQHHSSKASIFHHSAFFRSNSHICTLLLEKP